VRVCEFTIRNTSKWVIVLYTCIVYNIKLYYYVVERTNPSRTRIMDRSVCLISKSKSSTSLKIRVRDTLDVICSLLLYYIILHNIIFLTLDSVHYYNIVLFSWLIIYALLTICMSNYRDTCFI